MRRILVAALVLSPALLHAQVNAPAQPQSFSAKTYNVAAVSPSEIAPAAATTGSVRVSTGVIAPKLVHTVEVESDDNSLFTRTGLDRKVVVGMVVDKDGKPGDLKILASADAITDHNVLDAVAQYRFTPGTVSNQPTAVPVRLEMILRPSNR